MRKRLTYGVAILGAAGLLFAATAAQQGSGNQSAPPPGMMQGHRGMMQGRMGTMQGHMGMNNGGTGAMRGMMMAGLRDPVGRSVVMPFLLPEMKSELGLSSSQAAELNRLKQQFTNEEQKTSDQIVAARQDLNAQFSSGQPDESQFKKAANEIANLQVQRLLNSYKTAVKMKAALTPQQRSRLDAMSPTELRNAMMSHMTMRQMGQMMRYMYGGTGAGMMSGGVMGGGMMGMMGGGMRNGMRGGPAAPQQP